MNRGPAIYKLPLHPIFMSLEKARTDGTKLRNDIKSDARSDENTHIWVKRWQTLINKWKLNVQEELDKIYKTSKQSDEFEEGISNVADFSSPFNNLVWQITKSLKYLDKLLDEAYSYETQSRNIPITVPQHLLFPQTPTSNIHIGDIVNRDKNTGVKFKIDNSKGDKKTILWWILGIVAVVIGAWLIKVFNLN